MYSFARRPLWIVSHVLVLLGVLAMVRLGFWQMSRWHEESREADRVEAALRAEPVELDDLADPIEPPGEVGGSVEHRRVVLAGEWLVDETVVVRNRSLQGNPGGWLMTPLLRSDGTAVAVVRGWVPLEISNAGAPFTGTEPPEEPAVVTGSIGLTQQRRGLGPSDPAHGTIDSFARVDVQRYGQQLDVPLWPVWVMAETVEPAEPAAVVPVEPEVPTPSQNFSYMVQWWVFAAIAAGGYVLILVKLARSDRSPSQVPLDEPSVIDLRAGADPEGPRDVTSGV